MYVGRAVDDEGEVLASTVERRGVAGTAASFLRKLSRDQPVVPQPIVTDGLGSYKTALDRLGRSDRHRPGRLRENNRAENSHLPIRKRKRQMIGFKGAASAQRFRTVQAGVYNTFHTQRHLIRRRALRTFRARADAAWNAAMALCAANNLAIGAS